MSSPALVTPGSDALDPLGHLGTQERAVLLALAEDAGKIVSRRQLARRIGIENLSERRCDSILVGVRRVLGPDAIRTVRSRGWMLEASVLPPETPLTHPDTIVKVPTICP